MIKVEAKVKDKVKVKVKFNARANVNVKVKVKVKVKARVNVNVNVKVKVKVNVNIKVLVKVKDKQKVKAMVIDNITVTVTVRMKAKISWNDMIPFENEPVHDGSGLGPLHTGHLVVDEPVHDPADHLPLPPDLVGDPLVHPVQDERHAEHDTRLEHARISLRSSFDHCAPGHKVACSTRIR